METQTFTCPMHAEVKSDKPGTCPKCGMKLVPYSDSFPVAVIPPSQESIQSPGRRDLAYSHHSNTLYTCPMDPDVIMDSPGNCSKCGMKLVPMVSENHEGHEDHPPAGGSMEKEFKKRFFITLPFVLLSMFLSSMIQMWLGFPPAGGFTFPGKEIILFSIGTFIFF